MEPSTAPRVHQNHRLISWMSSQLHVIIQPLIVVCLHYGYGFYISPFSSWDSTTHTTTTANKKLAVCQQLPPCPLGLPAGSHPLIQSSVQSRQSNSQIKWLLWHKQKSAHKSSCHKMESGRKFVYYCWYSLLHEESSHCITKYQHVLLHTSYWPVHVVKDNNNI